MRRKDGNLEYISINKNFIRLLIGQGIMEFGDNFRIMAITMLLLELTGSGLAAGFSLVMTPIVGIVLSPLAGVLGDELEGKKFLSALYLLQGVLVILFINGAGLKTIYLVLILFAGIQIIQDPVHKKIIRDTLEKGDIIIGNSLSTGVSGFSNLVGPILGGMGIKIWGIDRVLIGSSIAYIVSSLLVFSIVDDRSKRRKLGKFWIMRNSKSVTKAFSSQMEDGIRYFKSTSSIKELGITSFIFYFGATSVSFAFYPLAFDIIGVTADGWGFILSVFYSTRLLAMFISIIANGREKSTSSYNLFFPLFFTCLSWFLYGLVYEFSYIIFALILEGTSHFLFEIFLWTRLQTISEKSLVARIVGINNILSNVARIVGIILAYIIIQFYSIQAVFIVNGILIFIFLFYKMVNILS